MAIAQNLIDILAARYGRDVRQSIHDGIAECYSDVSAAETLADAAAGNANVKAGLADTAASNADVKAALANTKAGLADTAASNADVKAALANTKAGLANTAASNADVKAALANTKAGLADTAALNADAKAVLANTKAELADTAAVNADVKAALANTKAGLADTAASNADAKAVIANNAASNADAKAGLADTAASNADAKAILANAAATNANTNALLADTAALNADAKAGVANTAASNADVKAALANTKAGLADTAALNADAKAGVADTAASNADTKALLADTAALNADAKAIIANTAASNADTKAALANTKALLADTAALNADAKADLADTAASNADVKAGVANTAATNADTKATLADTKAALADAKAILADTAALNADAKALVATTASDTADIATAAANLAATNADTEAGLTNTAAGNADAKAALADAAATNADAKAGLANTAATTANTKAGLANTAATNADTKATLANTKAGLADTAATNADAKAALADAAATNADEAAAYANAITQPYVHIKYSAIDPIANTDMLDTVEEWIGVYHGTSATPPVAYTAYTWYQFKGEPGDVTNHDHGNILNAGTIGQVAGKYLVTGTGGLIQTKDVILGGVNLLRNTHYLSGLAGWSISSPDDLATIVLDEVNLTPWEGPSIQVANVVLPCDLIIAPISMPFIAGEVYTVSFWLEGITTGVSAFLSDETAVPFAISALNQGYKRQGANSYYYYELQLPVTANYQGVMHLYIRLPASTRVCRVKMEFGTVVTDWSLSLFDTHSISITEIIDFPASLPASDVSAWAKAASKPTYSYTEIGAASTSDARLSDARTPVSHPHGNITNTGLIGTTAALPIITGTGGILQTGAFGTAEGQFAQGNDARLSDARVASDVSAWAKAGTKPTYTYTEVGAPSDSDARLSDARTPVSHPHGNITNGGLIGTIAALPIITGVSGILQVGAFGTAAGQFAQGNDPRLSYTPWKITQIGNPVSVSPVPESPLYVKVEGAYTQAGTGDPSPSNIRAITPWLTNGASALVKRTGKNLIRRLVDYTLAANAGATLVPVGDVLEVTTSGQASSGFYLTILEKPELYNVMSLSATKLSMDVRADAPFSLYWGKEDSAVSSQLTTSWQRISVSIPVVTTGHPIVVYNVNPTLAATKVYITNVQLELGSTATDYEPYIGEDISLIAPQEIAAGWMDNEAQGQGTWGKKVFDGTETFNHTQTTTGVQVFYISYSDKKPGHSLSISSHFKNIMWIWGEGNGVSGAFSDNPTGADTYFGVGNDMIGVVDGDTVTTKKANFAVWLAAQYAAGTPVTVYYELATPVALAPTIAPLFSIPQFDRLTIPVNVLTATPATDIELTYANETPVAHPHGNLTNDGKVGSTAGLFLKTGAAGVIEAQPDAALGLTFINGQLCVEVDRT